jgi:hypothetical protein
MRRLKRRKCDTASNPDVITELCELRTLHQKALREMTDFALKHVVVFSIHDAEFTKEL